MVRVRSSDFVVEVSEPFEHDRLDRRRRVEALCRLIVRVDSAAVVAVNGQFGSGKSVFLKMCAAQLRGQEVAVAEFNAWQQSHTREPLVDLVSALTGATSVGERLRGIAVNLAWRAVNVASRGFVVREDLSETEVTAKFAEWKEAEQKRAAFREALTELAAAEDNKLVVLIDELDRCLPAQALELLNVVRHLFDVPGVVVVLGIDHDELCHRVKKLYGETCEAETYLRRFVDLSVDLPDPRPELLNRFLNSAFDAAGVGERLQADGDWSGLMISAFAKRSGLSLRDMEQMAYRLARVLAVVPRPRYPNRWAPEHAAVALYVARMVTPAAYAKFRRRETTVFELARETMSALAISPDVAQEDESMIALLVLLIGFGTFRTLEELERLFADSGLGDADFARTIWEGLGNRERRWSPYDVEELFDVLELAVDGDRPQ